MGGGGGHKWSEDYIRSLPTAPSVDSLGSTFKPDLGKVVRVDRKVYEWFGGGKDGGGWEEMFTIPSDYSPEGAPPEGAPPEETGSGETSSGIPVMVPHLSSPSRSSSPVPSNPYYPQLVQEYDAPGLVDYSAYMPADSLFGYEQFQPATNPNNIPLSLFNYQPPTIYASDPRAGVGLLATPGGIIEGGHIRPTVGIEAATSSTPSSSTPVGSAGYPVGDPRNPEDRGGPDRPGADSDTQTRVEPFPSEFPIAIGAYSTNTLAEDVEANKAKQKALADIRAAEKAATLPGLVPASRPDLAAAEIAAELAAAQRRARQMESASDWEREKAEEELSKAISKAIAATVANPHYSAMPAGLASHPERAEQERAMDLGYFGGLGGSPSGGGGSTGGPGTAGPGGDFGGSGHSRR